MSMTTRERHELLALFGTIAHALRRLDCAHLDYQRARRVLVGQVRRGPVADELRDAWRAWCRQYLLAHVVPRADYGDFIRLRGEAAEALEDELLARARRPPG